ncbi:MAG: PadR family transcriptional regulator [Ilumatobacteraceae bacterium]|nr:PadR family transcriptional regulator [Ilumatobacteraceae bacterium]
MDPRSQEHDHHHEHDHRGRFGRNGGPALRGGRGEGGFGRRGRGGRGGFGFGFDPDAMMGRGPRRGRGDVRTAVLMLLLERPMHGYEMIQEIKERSAEAWSPSPGAIYPTLQLLTDEGLITTDELDGKKVSKLTDVGRTAADELKATKTAPWDEASADAGDGAVDLRHSIHQLLGAVRNTFGGTNAQRQKVGEILDEARRKIYAMLATDES